MSADITILILTMNEEDNLPKALASVAGFARRVVVVDSGSTDRTVEIAREAGADVYENAFVNHAIQVNWGIDNTEISDFYRFGVANAAEIYSMQPPSLYKAQNYWNRMEVRKLGEFGRI